MRSGRIALDAMVDSRQIRLAWSVEAFEEQRRIL